MGSIESFFRKKGEIKEKDIKQFISQKIEENSNLEYKDIRAYQDVEKLSTHISSFANSEGGLLILGISQDEIKDDKSKKVKIFPTEVTWGKRFPRQRKSGEQTSYANKTSNKWISNKTSPQQGQRGSCNFFLHCVTHATWFLCVFFIFVFLLRELEGRKLKFNPTNQRLNKAEWLL